jgi:hypothetical protein
VSNNINGIRLESIMAVKPFFVRAEWDEEASVWVAISNPGILPMQFSSKLDCPKSSRVGNVSVGI